MRLSTLLAFMIVRLTANDSTTDSEVRLINEDGEEYWTVSDIDFDQDPYDPPVIIEPSTIESPTTETTTLTPAIIDEIQIATEVPTPTQSTISSVTFSLSSTGFDARATNTASTTSSVTSAITSTTKMSTVKNKMTTAITTPENTTQSANSASPELFMSLTALLFTIFTSHSMNNSILDDNFEAAIVIFHHYSGAIFFIINMFVALLIVLDSDPRGKKYRKYLFALQFISTLFDVLWGCYTPILIVNIRFLYSNSLIAKYLDIIIFTAIEFFLFGGVVNAYFSCVYYRLNIVLPSASHSVFRRIGLFFALQTGVGVICVCGYFVLSEARSSDQTIPDFLCWTTCKVSFFLLHETFLLYAFGTVACLWGFFMFVVIAGMIARVLKELRGGMQKASTATRMYQKRAIVSLVFQGTIPSMFYVLPALVEGLLYLITLIEGLETVALNSMMSSASAIAFSLITLHTVAHSITIIACSPAYKRTIRRLVVETINIMRGRSTVEAIPRQSLQVSRFDYSRY